MSLVAAYGSSDESEESEAENETEAKQTQESAKQSPEQDAGECLEVHGQELEDSANNTEPDVEDSAVILPIDHDHVTTNHISDSDGEEIPQESADSKSFDTLLKGLPAPHSTSADVITENDELEEEVRPKQSQMADIPKPPPKRTRQPVKITLPALEQDSDEDEPSKKKPRSANTGGKSGLTSLLPAPVHAAKKETNRILLPYSLSKKHKPDLKPKPKFEDKPPSPSYTQKKYSMFHGLTGYDSDSDENEDENVKNSEPVNFFSLDSTQKSVKEQTNLSSLPDQTGSGVPTVSLPRPPSEHSPTDQKQSDLGSSKLEITTPVQGPSLPQVDPDAPLTFKGGLKSRTSIPIAGSYVLPSANTSGHVAESSSFESETQEEIHQDQNMYYNMPYAQTSNYVEATDVKALEQDEEFLKLQGKPKRGKEEINFLEVNTADFISTAEVTKSLSEEQEHRSHKKKDLPSAQQKRKHQIGYLAFQARERELELKNQWATNRLTRKQTQAKYGF